MPSTDQWMSTKEASERLGITLRTLYRLIDEGQVAAYKFGRVIRLQTTDVEAFLGATKIAPGQLHHLYPDTKSDAATDQPAEA